jgi:hypothetical protein
MGMSTSFATTSGKTMNPSAMQAAERSVIITDFGMNWEEITKGGFTASQVIDAYLIGKEHGRTEEQRILSKTFEVNIKKAFSISEEKFGGLKKIFGIEPVEMRMRVLGIALFETLFILSANDYNSEKIEAVYGLLMEEMDKFKSEEFTWSFVVMPSAEKLNDDAMSADGFSLRYSHKAA